MESSPNTRLTRLKKEIKLLDQQIFKSTTERSPIPKNQQVGQSTYRYSPQKKNTQQQQLNNLSPSKKSEHPNTQLSQLNYKLKDLANKKQQQHTEMLALPFTQQRFSIPTACAVSFATVKARSSNVYAVSPFSHLAATVSPL